MTILRSLLTASLLAAPVAAGAQTTILFNNFLGPNDTLYTQVVHPWLEAIEDATEGRVTFEIPEASLAPPPELLSMVQTGIADGGFIMTGFLEGSNPLLQIALLPGVNTDAEAGSVAYWRTYEQHLAQADVLPGVELLGLLTVVPGSFYSMTDTVFDEIGDFNGAKFFALPGYASRALSALGAVVSPGPAVRMYEVISGGVVDAYCCINYPSVQNFNVQSFTRSSTEMPIGFFAPAFAFYVSSDIWATISAEDQATIRALSGEALARRLSVADETNRTARQAFVDAGAEIHAASEGMVSDLYAAWAPLYQAWIDSADALGVDGAAALDFYRAQVADIASGN